MSAETPRPPRDALSYALEGVSEYTIRDADYVLGRLARRGYHLVRDGQAVHDGQVYDLAYTYVRASRELSLRDPDTDEVVGWVSETPLYRLRPVSQGIPATKEQQRGPTTETGETTP